MKSSIQLIIPFDKKSAELGIKIMPLPIAILTAMFFFTFVIVSPQLTSFLDIVLMPTIRYCLGFLIALILLGIIQLYFYIKNPDPLATIYHEGIKIKGFGLIRWKDIDDVVFYSTVYTGERKVVGIQVKSFIYLLKKVNWGAKIGICSAKMFGYPPISISSTIISNDEIIKFAKQYIPEK